MKPRLATMKVTQEQKQWLEKEAKRTGRTITEVVRSLIREAMETKS
jgi:predicted DNA-binding protein